jgi:hypothetical protein
MAHMLLRFLLPVLSGLFLLCAPAHALDWRGVEVDPQAEIRPTLLRQALASYEQHRGSEQLGGTMMVVDFSKPSSQERLYLVDMRSGSVRALLVAHGQGSDRNHDGMADFFSNEDGSHASSIGAFRAAERYQGGHGLSLRLDGLESTNRSARPRAIVIHSQWYVSRELAQRGRLGRSWGCFVVEPSEIEPVVAALENGGFIYAGR